ncbi:transmembrane protein 26-like [Mytilus californianus]|uniref:transmembrane protein 26-like n=1 Tax=Mytilus californianus TaxID=6549 RepID=UPI002247E6C6|nr:transmembrane protein 26-like [Mytilus californianus]
MLKNLWNIISAVAVRVILMVHCFLAVWRAADVKNNDLYWLMALTNVFMVAEGIFRIVKKDAQESKWFSPCILFYLAGTVPAIWILEIDRLEKFTEISASANITNAQNEALSAINGVTLPVKLDADTWVSVLEQSMLFIFILARWMLPRGRITRDQLSQLLFVYIGSASDVMELFVVFEEPEIRSDLYLSYATLGVWSLSLFQFCLILTSTRDIGGKTFARETDLENEVPENTPMGEEKEKMPSCCDRVFEVEIWSLCISMFLQDGPFLVVRLYSIIVKGVLSYGILFFTAKNVLVLCLQFYRIVVICKKINTVGSEEEDKPTPLKARKSVAPEKKTSKQSLISNIGSTSTKNSFLDP